MPTNDETRAALTAAGIPAEVADLIADADPTSAPLPANWGPADAVAAPQDPEYDDVDEYTADDEDDDPVDLGAVEAATAQAVAS